MKIFVVGFPKAGTTSIHYSLIKAGIKSNHWAWYNCPSDLAYVKRFSVPAAPVGMLIKRAKEENLPLLHYLSEFDAFTQMDVSLNEELNYWPQMEDISTLDAQYPGSKFIFNDRPMEKWLKSVIHWGTLRRRLGKLDIPGLPLRVGYLNRELINWYNWHKNNMINYFKGRDNFIIFNIENDSPQKLADFLGLESIVWSQRNKSKR
jgi:hypothetical protein